MFCKNCGKELSSEINYCPYCGTPQFESSRIRNINNVDNKNVSKRSRTIAACLAFFLGAFGIHRFYLGKNKTGILQIILTCCLGVGAIWALIDFAIILCGTFRDNEGLLVSNWDIV